MRDMNGIVMCSTKNVLNGAMTTKAVAVAVSVPARSVNPYAGKQVAMPGKQNLLPVQGAPKDLIAAHISNYAKNGVLIMARAVAAITIAAAGIVFANEPAAIAGEGRRCVTNAVP